MADRRKLLKGLLPFAVLAAAVAVVGALVATRPETPVEKPKEPVSPVKLVTAHPASRSPQLILYGHLESKRSSTVEAAVAAEVRETPVLEGQRVKQGQVLVRLVRDDLERALRQRGAQVERLDAQIRLENQRHKADQASLESERHLLALANKELDRIQSLRKRGATSQQQVDSARQAVEQRRLAVTSRDLSVNSYQSRLADLKAQREAAQAALEQARSDLEHTVIRAPFDGRVAKVQVAEGERVAPGQPVVSVYDTSALEVRAPIPSGHYPIISRALESGRPLTATGSADGVHLQLVLERLAGSSAKGQAGVQGLFAVRGSHPDLVLGRFVTVELSLPAQPRVVAVPYQALYGRDRVYRMVDGRMQGVAVEHVGDQVSDSGERLALVRSSELHDGDRIIATQIPRAMDGLRVQEASAKEGE